jgi:hypothetical protein
VRRSTATTIGETEAQTRQVLSPALVTTARFCQRSPSAAVISAFPRHAPEGEEDDELDGDELAQRTQPGQLRRQLVVELVRRG